MTRKALGLADVADLDNEKRVRILGIIDKIRELGVSENVSLPQSSGKSSLLEGLTGLSFPIASDLCTRFATQIVLRRAPAEDAEVRVTIIPGPSAQADQEIKERLIRFERKLSSDEFDNEKFQNIFDEVCFDKYLGAEMLTGSRLQNAWAYQVRAPKSLKTSKSGSPMISSGSSCLGLNTTTSVLSMSQGYSIVSKNITTTASFLISQILPNIRQRRIGELFVSSLRVISSTSGQSSCKVPPIRNRTDFS
ncbi:hypothetical protein J1614_000900 [Plenodomus biglobosus]|nr:hypothetical protein J1614_000900 [Plenodomus biglobosus]